MKATIEFDDRLYRRLKIEAASRNKKIREMVEEGVRMVLDGVQQGSMADKHQLEATINELPIVRKATNKPMPLLNNQEIDQLLDVEEQEKYDRANHTKQPEKQN